MSAVPELRTERLLLRGWTDADRTGMFAVNGDPAVMATIGPVMSREQSDAFVDRMTAAWAERGYGLWCVDLDGACIGFTGLSTPLWGAPFVAELRAAGRPCVEVGWRLAAPHWGHGYATEAGRAALRFAFDDLGLEELVSFTAVTNERSGRVMEKLGLRRDPANDFEHPSVPPGHALRAHVLYRVTRGARSEP